MNYVIFDKESGEIVDVINFTSEQKVKYEKANLNHEVTLEEDLLHNVLDDDEYIDELEDDDFDL